MAEENGIHVVAAARDASRLSGAGDIGPGSLARQSRPPWVETIVAPGTPLTGIGDLE
ncbi:hypothetical protein [Mesorhizobium cantuariense]|uniref:Uncharacterized protein n=1 Tax=Mesorhizobium cantuariense TaxID=1300275 RepID=A0ABV7MUU5_9HYPH